LVHSQSLEVDRPRLVYPKTTGTATTCITSALDLEDNSASEQMCATL